MNTLEPVLWIEEFRSYRRIRYTSVCKSVEVSDSVSCLHGHVSDDSYNQVRSKEGKLKGIPFVLSTVDGEGQIDPSSADPVLLYRLSVDFKDRDLRDSRCPEQSLVPCLVCRDLVLKKRKSFSQYSDCLSYYGLEGVGGVCVC